MRRKRNLDLSQQKQPLPPTQYISNDVEELEEGYEEIELESELENNVVDFSKGDEMGVLFGKGSNKEDEGIDFNSCEQIFINGQPFIPKQIKKKQPFAETHVRITTYLEKSVHQIIRILQKQGQIESITKFINESIKAHLLDEYNKNKN